jgi:hypothetical protein
MVVLSKTVSAAFPQLYYGDLADVVGLNQKQNKLNANTNIIEAIRKIKMRQFIQWSCHTLGQ